MRLSLALVGFEKGGGFRERAERSQERAERETRERERERDTHTHSRTKELQRVVIVRVLEYWI